MPPTNKLQQKLADGAIKLPQIEILQGFVQSISRGVPGSQFPAPDIFKNCLTYPDVDVFADINSCLCCQSQLFEAVNPAKTDWATVQAEVEHGIIEPQFAAENLSKTLCKLYLKLSPLSSPGITDEEVMSANVKADIFCDIFNYFYTKIWDSLKSFYKLRRNVGNCELWLLSLSRSL